MGKDQSGPAPVVREDGGGSLVLRLCVTVWTPTDTVTSMRNKDCPMCMTPITGPAYLVDGALKHRRRWTAELLLICGPCYTRGAPDPETGLLPAPAHRETPRVQWHGLVGRGEKLPPTPCAACGMVVVRNDDPLLKRVTCSRACSTSLTRSRNGGKGSGKPCQVCEEPVTTGRADSLYCSPACRQKAYRQRISHA
ncbi:hypothetical protein DFP74_5778 [Nocardiopsis sp. Huas11]|nr:hypothetical protein DFP74_5778 [Nocardiopsis sp. Huas11]